MTDIVDVMSAVRGAVFQALDDADRPDGVQVFDDVPQDTQPPFLKLGTLDSEADAPKGEQLERLTVEIIGVYRGKDRGVMLAMMHAARVALDRQILTADGVDILRCRFVTQSVSDASQQDGVTYAGIANYEIWAEPA